MFIVDDRGPVRWLTINRPDRLNAIPPDGWQALAHQWRAFETSAQRVLVVTGAGGNFCSGADLGGDGSVSRLATDRFAAMAGPHAAALALHHVTKPTIAAVEGVAVGAGMNLALGCDVVVAAETARFSEIFVRRGLTLDFGGTWLLPRAVGLQRAKELALSGRMVEATEAVDIGLALEVVPVADLHESVTAHARRFAGGAPVAQRIAKAGLHRSMGWTLEEALDYESQGQAICLASDDAFEGVSAFLDKRDPNFRGS